MCVAFFYSFFGLFVSKKWAFRFEPIRRLEKSTVLVENSKRRVDFSASAIRKSQLPLLFSVTSSIKKGSA